MSNFLAQLLGGSQAALSAGEQLAQAQQQTFSPAMEKKARANGFKSAAEMMAWSAQRNQQSGGTVPRDGRPSIPAGANAAAAMHPKNMFEMILGKWQDAMGGN